ncbi:MAG: hypothetical protein HYV33_01400 [Candidatus Kerfeldbacteria bacterium]|nr:hypothetical protein [Candidatus Kerfeldbacteria bacterium]
MKRFQSLVISGSIILSTVLPQLAGAAVWQEPTCDPSTDPSACNIAVPLNVSSSAQTKQGALTVVGSLTVNNGFTLAGGLLSLPDNSVTDPMVSDNLTASIFHSGGSTDAVDLNSTEVSGTLSAVAVEDIWVNVIGDTMSGKLLIQNNSSTGIEVQTGSNTRGIEIAGVTSEPMLSVNQQGSSGDAISLNLTDDSLGNGLIITSTSISSSTTYPLNIINNGSTSRAVNIQTQTTGGYGIYSVSTLGSGGTAIYGVGDQYGVYGASHANSNSIGVFGESTKGTAIFGKTTASNAAGVIGQATATGSNGISGNSSLGIGVIGDTQANTPNTPGVMGCTNNTNCGMLGTATMAGIFQGDVWIDATSVSARTLHNKDQLVGNTSYYAGKTKTKVSPDPGKHLSWDFARWVGNDGDEVVVLTDDNAGNSEAMRLDATTGQIIAVTDFTGSIYPFFDGVLTENQFITIESHSTSAAAAGRIWEWDKRSGTVSNTCPVAPTGCGDPKLYDIVDLAYDGKYLWAGRSAATGTIDPIIRFEDTTGGYIYQSTTVASNVREVLELVNGGYSASDGGEVMWALVDVTGFASNYTRLFKIFRDTGVVVQTIDLNDTVVGKHMTYDGRSLWITTVGLGSGLGGLMQYDTVSGQQYYYTLQSSFGQFSNPDAIIFDGDFLWVALLGSNTVTRVQPLAVNRSNVTIINNAFFSIGDKPQYLNFDGEYIWAMTGGNGSSSSAQLVQLISGKGYGSQMDTASSGITLYNVGGSFHDPDPYCLFMDGPITAASLQITSGACPLN